LPPEPVPPAVRLAPLHAAVPSSVCDLYGSVVDFEVCVHNVDKAAMNFQSLQERERDLLAVLSDKYYFGNLHFTHTATFVQKAELDRKSTRLNSSHVKISYAVFCL